MRYFRSKRKQNIISKKNKQSIKDFAREMFLIVFAILLALYIDKCSEDKSSENQKIIFVKSYINDLKRDLRMLERYKKLVKKDTLYIGSIIKRTKSPEANFDTLLNIYLNEFETKVYTMQGFNDNSLKTMTYSGNNEIFTPGINSAISELNGSHYEFVRGFNYVFEDFISFISS